jgi:hypothetical protein
VGTPLAAALATLVAGCSLILDTDKLPSASPDAPPEADAPPVPVADAPFDANPELLDLTGVDPGELIEGIGSAQGRPIVLVVTGESLTAAAVFDIFAAGTTDPDPRIHVGAWVVSIEGNLAATTVTVDVDEDLDAGTVPLEVSVTQAGVTRTIGGLVLRGLPELETTAAGSIATTALAAMYSRIEIAHATALTGDANHPALLRATGEIVVSAPLTANASGQDAGPGGCRGGDAAQPGGCQGGGGGAGGFSGLNAGGGGGGGFAANGSPGLDPGHGNGGFESGDDMLSGLLVGAGEAGNRGNGGGGSGGTSVGGGAGGTIALNAGGTITISGTGLAANGGDGADGGLCLQVAGTLGNAGGGGGSGGAIVVRSGAGITVSPTPWISVTPGAGGTASVGACFGGAGSGGRIRIDTPGDVFPTWSLAPVVRGPAWRDPPAIVRSSTTMLTLTGGVGATFPLLEDLIPLPDIGIFDPAGTALVTIDNLTRGHNQVCAKTSASAQVTDREAVSCVDVVYVP